MSRAYRGAVVLLGVWGLLAFLTGQADAQQGRQNFGRGFGGGFNRGSIFNLIGMEQVQKELELTEEQKTEVDKISDAARQEIRQLFDGVGELPQEELQKKQAELRGKSEARQAEAEKKIDSILLAHQRVRLKEISYNVRGMSALADKDVADALSLNDDQSQKLKTIRDETQRETLALFQGGGDGGNREARDKVTNLRRQAEEQSLAVLTSEQKTKWDQMKGKRFELEMGRGNRGRNRGNNNEANPPL